MKNNSLLKVILYGSMMIYSVAIVAMIMLSNPFGQYDHELQKCRSQGGSEVAWMMTTNEWHCY